MFWKGPLFTKDGFVDTCIDLETCELVNKNKEEDGIIVPLFRNCHTHLGDTGARKSLPDNLNLTELVGPDGWKHKWLEENDIEKLKPVFHLEKILILKLLQGRMLKMSKV